MVRRTASASSGDAHSDLEFATVVAVEAAAVIASELQSRDARGN
jgi:hypothetical protein